MIIGVSGAVIVLLVVIGALLLAPKNTINSTPTPRPEADQLVAETTSPVATAGTTQEFTVEGGEFFFKPNLIKVKKGDTVKIIFNNSGGMHDWVLDEFKARTKVIRSGESATVEFVADKTGSFEYYCSVSQHRQLGMKGTLIVE